MRTDHCRVRLVNRSGFPAPVYETAGASGLDLRAAIEKEMVLVPHRVYQIPTGIYLEMPAGCEAQVRARSGLALKHGVAMANGVGTIDADYRGEIAALVIVLIDEPFTLRPGDRIAQLVFAPVVQPEIVAVETVDALDQTNRGTGGFGHTGR
jgi:dUTP pyrophosphatase